MAVNTASIANDVIASMQEIKAIDIKKLPVNSITSITDDMIIASGQSQRQVKAIAQKVIEHAKHKQVQVLGVEGLEQGQWVLIDLGDVIAHVMHPDTREYYQLEKLWSLDAEQTPDTN